MGADAADWARPVVHWELHARDPQILRAFYSALFHWDIADGFIMGVPAGLGGPEPGPNGHIIAAGEGMPTGFGLFVQVLDIPSSLTRAVELGGSIAGAPFDVPGGPTICTILDPEGNRITLVQQ